MSKLDWSKAPAGAEWWAYGTWWKAGEGKKEFSYHVEYGWCLSSSQFSSKLANNYEPRPTEWPETDERINNIGLNRTEDDMGHYNELREAQSAQKVKAKSKYHRVIKGVEIDVYSVLKAYGVTCPAIAHAIKKLLLPGERHAKTWEQDINEAIASLERAKELRND